MVYKSYTSIGNSYNANKKKKIKRRDIVMNDREKMLTPQKIIKAMKNLPNAADINW